MDGILEEIRRERKRQDRKWGADRNLENTLWLTILVEEVGEVADTILEHYPPKTMSAALKAELIQIAAVAVAWIENIDRDELPF